MCKIDHTEPDGLPSFLCRTCHPELIPSRAERELVAAVFKAEADHEMARQRRMRELHKAHTKLVSVTKRGEPDEGSINGKLAKSMRKKIARLEQEAKEAGDA
jgi:hypothetical protein